MPRERMTVRTSLVATLVVSVSLLLGVTVQPASAAPARIDPTSVSAVSDGTTVTRTAIGTYAGEEYVAEQTLSVATAAAPQARCPAPSPDATMGRGPCGPQCRTLESTYVIYVIPTYQTLVRWRVHYRWCWEGNQVISATHTETTPDILSSTIRVSGSISRSTSRLPAVGSADVYTEGLQFDVVVLGVSVKAFNPKLRFVLTSSGMAYNLSVLA